MVYILTVKSVCLKHEKIIKAWKETSNSHTLFVSVSFGSEKAANFDRDAIAEIETIATEYVKKNRAKANKKLDAKMLHAYVIEFLDQEKMRVVFEDIRKP